MACVVTMVSLPAAGAGIDEERWLKIFHVIRLSFGRSVAVPSQMSTQRSGVARRLLVLSPSITIRAVRG